MSLHPSGYHISNTAPSANGAIGAKRIACLVSGFAVLAAGAAINQANTQQAIPIGITLSDVADEGFGDYIDGGDQPIEVIAGTGGLATGEEFVVEAATGAALGITTGSVTLLRNDRICGYVVRGAAAGDIALVRWQVRRLDSDAA